MHDCGPLPERTIVALLRGLTVVIREWRWMSREAGQSVKNLVRSGSWGNGNGVLHASSLKECSASCAGGVHNFTRSVTVPPELGAACPPLTLEQACNVQECPIDCKISEWSGWSACSAKCGGGVRERMRTISEHARFGGMPCGSASQTEPCNMQACFPFVPS